MRHLAAVALMFAVSYQSPQSQSQQTAHPVLLTAPAPLVEKIDVSVVNVDVTVTDRHGRPIPGLTRDDFEVLEDGKPQPISNFYVVENSLAKRDVPATGASDAQTAPDPDRFRRKVLVLIDNVNTTPHGRNIALDRLEKFVNEHFDDGRYDWSIAMIDKHVRMILPMTSNKRALHNVVAEIRSTGTRKAIRTPIDHSEFKSISGLQSLKGEMAEVNTPPELTSNATIAIYDDEAAFKEQSIYAHSSTASIVEAARAFGSSEGRKFILLVTGYLPLGTLSPIDRGARDIRDGSHIQDVVSQDQDFDYLRQRLVREANASNTSIYIISAEGLEMPLVEGVSSMSAQPRTRSNALDTSPMFWLAKETGGAYLPGNKLDRSFDDFDRRSATFYSLGYKAPHPDDSKYHRLSVIVKGHSEYRLQYRDGYSSAPTDAQMMRALLSPLGASMQPATLTMSLIVGQPQYRGLVALVPLKAAMSMESLQYISDAKGSRTRLHVYVSVFDRDGRNITLAKSFADISVKPDETTTGPMTVTIPSVALSKGTYRIVVAVRDELTDKVALAEHKVDV
jgi:VWFA-related protein